MKVIVIPGKHLSDVSKYRENDGVPLLKWSGDYIGVMEENEVIVKISPDKRVIEITSPDRFDKTKMHCDYIFIHPSTFYHDITALKEGDKKEKHVPTLYDAVKGKDSVLYQHEHYYGDYIRQVTNPVKWIESSAIKRKIAEILFSTLMDEINFGYIDEVARFSTLGCILDFVKTTREISYTVHHDDFKYDDMTLTFYRVEHGPECVFIHLIQKNNAAWDMVETNLIFSRNNAHTHADFLLALLKKSKLK